MALFAPPKRACVFIKVRVKFFRCPTTLDSSYSSSMMRSVVASGKPNHWHIRLEASVG